MKSSFVAMLVMALVSSGATPAQEDAAKKELARMEGEWRLMRGEDNGEAASEYVLKHLEVVVKGNQLTFKNIAPLTDKAGTLTAKVDPSTTPKCIDLKVESGSLKGSVLEGVYECNATELKLCLFFATGPQNRPLEFEAKTGSNRVLFLLKRK